MTSIQSKKTLVFIEKAKAKHGDQYDYSLVEYVKNNEKVSIICPEHGIFNQVPGSHLSGSACPKCGLDRGTNLRRTTLSDFIKKAKKIHGDRYDYALTEYKSNYKKVAIICQEHGIFQQRPNDHLSGQGCPKCGSIQIGIARKTTQSDFIKKAQIKHGNRYDYSETIYEDSREKIIIGCRIHGDFTQVANSHLCGRGCPECAKLARIEHSKPSNLT